MEIPAVMPAESILHGPVCANPALVLASGIAVSLVAALHDAVVPSGGCRFEPPPQRLHRRAVSAPWPVRPPGTRPGAHRDGYGAFLPRWEEWFSGLVPYPQLLASQMVIVLGCGKVCRDFIRQRGFFVTPRRWLGILLLSIGSVYFATMVLRYAIRMSLYPPERWTGGAIPIVFHWVLAAFILVLGAYHWRSSPAPVRRSRAARVMRAVACLAIVSGVLVWAGYQLLPTILAAILDTRRPEHAVRIERGVAMTTSDGVKLLADVYVGRKACVHEGWAPSLRARPVWIAVPQSSRPLPLCVQPARRDVKPSEIITGNRPGGKRCQNRGIASF